MTELAKHELWSGKTLLKVACLLLMIPQYAVLILTMRYVRTRPGPLFVTSTVIFLTEVVKTAVCLVLLLVHEQSLKGWASLLYDHMVARPTEMAKILVPSLIFVVQNNLVFVAVSNLDAATFQVTYQLKILTTALFCMLILGKKLSRLQWLALFILFVGESIVQIQPSTSSATSKDQNTLNGLLAVLACCFLSGFANVYIEKILKGGDHSIWLRNVQLGSTGALIAALAVFVQDGKSVQEKGFLYGYDWVVWVVVGLQSIGGLLVAAVIKYADNILKGFSTAGSIVLSCIASVYFFDFHISAQFLLGTTLVFVSIFLYLMYPPPAPVTILTVARPLPEEEQQKEPEFQEEQSELEDEDSQTDDVRLKMDT